MPVFGSWYGAITSRALSTRAFMMIPKKKLSFTLEPKDVVITVGLPNVSLLHWSANVVGFPKAVFEH